MKTIAAAALRCAREGDMSTFTVWVTFDVDADSEADAKEKVYAACEAALKPGEILECCVEECIEWEHD